MSRAKLLVAVGVAVCALSVAGGLALLRAQGKRQQLEGERAAAPRLTPPPREEMQAPAPRPAQDAPVAASPAAAQSQEAELLRELNAALPRLGVKPPARLVAAAAHGDHLTLTFSSEFRPYLTSVSALDELTAMLSGRIHPHGYRHLNLLLRDERGRAVSIDDLVQTPPARRPRPEPIDDGVRR